MIETSLKLLDQGYYEAKFAFEGLADEHVWKRPAPALLSVGELAGHMAYWQARRLTGEGEDLTKCRVVSPLIDNRFAYYPKTVAAQPSEQQRAMTAEQVWQELLRVHRESIAHFNAAHNDPDSPIPGDPFSMTYAQYLEYAVFHTAYHTGQIYTVRHLLGEVTPDN